MVLGVSGLPTVAAEGVVEKQTTTVATDHEAAIALAFYRALAAVRVELWSWQDSAEPDEVLDNARYAVLWDRVVRDQAILDPYGRPMLLVNLPEGLAERADPRLVVSDATRLPEDVEAWAPFVALRRME